jgi:hypothetical protein
MSNGFTSKNPSTPQVKRGRLRRRRMFGDIMKRKYVG